MIRNPHAEGQKTRGRGYYVLRRVGPYSTYRFARDRAAPATSRTQTWQLHLAHIHMPYYMAAETRKTHGSKYGDETETKDIQNN